MADQIRCLSLLVSLGLTAVALALGYWHLVAAEDLLRRPTNPRLVEEERRIVRGRILDRNGEVLASSKRTGEIAERTYHYEPLAHVTGYVSTRYGKSGIEQALDSFLRGERAADPIVEVRNRLFRADRRGTDVWLTIDLRLQQVADEALRGNRGAIVAINVPTGEVLAMASHPYFDPNSLDDQWQRLSEDPAGPLVHRAIQGEYVPGSAFKVVTVGAALDLGLADPNQRHRHEGDLVVQGFTVRNTNHPQLRELTFAEEFAWSCNPAHALIGLQLGFPERIDIGLLGMPQPYVWNRTGYERSVERFREYALRYGMGEPVPFDLPTAAGRISSRTDMDPVLLASSAFGQGELAVSPLQMALAAATIPNSGMMPAPYLAAYAGDETNSVALHRPGGTLRRVMRPESAAALNAMMVLSVNTAYAQPARIAGVSVGGKTGTAETGRGNPHAWFIGYAPAERPGVAVAVIMENRGSGTTFAAPAAQRLMEAALRLGY